MRTRLLGNTGYAISRIGLGAWAIGGDWKWGWGPQDDEASIKTIHKALNAGINWIDTAAVYGLGHSESIIAKALDGMQERPWVFTKCERVWGKDGIPYPCLKKESIQKECEASLRRLKVDCLDLYQIHWPTPEEDIEEAWEALCDIQRQGKARYIGVSNFNKEQMERLLALDLAPINSLQPPYSLLNREYEKEILPYCLDKGIGTLVYSPMGSGMLTGKMSRERIASLPDTDWRKGHPWFNPPQLDRNLALAGLLEDEGKKLGISAAELAIAWTLNNPAVTGAIVGMRKPDQVDSLLKAADVSLPDELLRQLSEFTLS